MDWEVLSFDIRVAFMRARKNAEIFVEPANRYVHAGKYWTLKAAIHAMQVNSDNVLICKDAKNEFRSISFTYRKLDRDLVGEEHGEDFLIVGTCQRDGKCYCGVQHTIFPNAPAINFSGPF